MTSTQLSSEPCDFVGPAAWRASDDELAALVALGRGGRWTVHGRDLKLTNLDKPLFPGRDGEPPVTKGELVRYYAAIAPHLLPYLVGRPVTMHRYPDGVGRGGFWQKEVPDHAPEWLPRWHDTDADPGETRCYTRGPPRCPTCTTPPGP